MTEASEDTPPVYLHRLYLPRGVGRHAPVQQQLGHIQAPVLGCHMQGGEAFLKQEQQGERCSPSRPRTRNCDSVMWEADQAVQGQTARALDWSAFSRTGRERHSPPRTQLTGQAERSDAEGRELET